MSKIVYYLAGPMSWVPQFNIPLFERVTAELREKGFEVFSPAELDSPGVRERALASPDGAPAAVEHIETWGDMLARDVKLIADKCQGIIFLPDWEKSRGARLEAFVGILCGCTFMEYIPPSFNLRDLPALRVMSKLARATYAELRGRQS